MEHISDEERRRRIAVRHRLHPSSRAESPEVATAAVTVLHATEPASVYLSLRARLIDPDRAETDRALYRDRSLVKQLAMRRTLFVFPRELLPAAWGSASLRVAGTELKRLVKDVEASGISVDGAAWVERASGAVLELLEAEGAMLTADLREQLPELAGRLTGGPSEASYAASVPVAPRVLSVLGAEGRIVRGNNSSHWRVSRPTWATMESWLGESSEPLPAPDGYTELVRRWLWSFGPGTETDLVWWLGATKSAVRRALAEVEAVQVSLDGPIDEPGWVLPGDEGETELVGPWVALLPVLDPTVMGWKQRDFYLGAHAGDLFDRNGNAGTTAWVDGRIVGCWVQDGDGVVDVLLSEPVSPQEQGALDAEASVLTDWLAGERVGTVYPSPAMKRAR